MYVQFSQSLFTWLFLSCKSKSSCIFHSSWNYIAHLTLPFFRLVPIPFPTRRATFKEVKRVHEILMTIELHKESLDEIKGKLVSKDERKSRGFAKGSSPVKRKEIRRSKSRDSPVRELPDFVQSLANEADSQSEPDEENLEEYEVNARTSRRASKAGGKKVVIQHEQVLLNSLVTACKTGDLKLLNLLLETDPSQVKAQILESFGESKLTLLHIAAAEGHAKIIQALMENGADPTIRDKFKKTPYSYCPDKNSRSSFRRYQVINKCTLYSILRKLSILKRSQPLFFLTFRFNF